MAGVTAFVALLTLFGLAHERDNAFAATLSGLFGDLVLSLPLWAILISLGRRLSQPDASHLLEADERAPILLLRSFSDDPKQIRAKGLAIRVLSPGFYGRKRLEAAIAPEIAQLGPFIAIGRPGEKLPIHFGFSGDGWSRPGSPPRRIWCAKPIGLAANKHLSHATVAADSTPKRYENRTRV